MESKKQKGIFVFSIIFYLIAIGLMIAGSLYDLQIDKALFNPESKFAIGFETIGLFVYWGMWGPLFTVLFLTRHNLNECLDMLGRVFPFIKTVKDTQTKAYKFFNFVVQAIWTLGFFVLTDVGWKKLIENVLKNFVDLSQGAYFGICAAVSVISILIFSRIDKKTLNKLESLALAGVLFGILLKLVDIPKDIFHRVRFREMVAASNGIFNEKGLSQGALDGMHTSLNRGMMDGTDFSAFTNWYKIGDDRGIYAHPSSFPSGHTASSCTLFLSVLFCNAFDKLKKAAPFALAVSVIYVAVMGFSRMVAGAHYLTDVAGGAILAYTLFIIVLAVYNKFIDKGILPTRRFD